MTTKHRFFNVFYFLLLAVFMLPSCGERSGNPRVLVYSSDAGDASVAESMAALAKLGGEQDFEVDTTTNERMFTESNLAPYAAVIFLNTTGEELSYGQKVNFERYMQAGGGFVGIHEAADTAYSWDWYGRLVGGRYEGYPQTKEAVVRVAEAGHPATNGLPEQWTRQDAWLEFNQLVEDVKVLLTMQEGAGDVNPVSWYHDFEGGRSFYTALEPSVGTEDELFRQHLIGGIKYAIGENNSLDYARATSLKVPEEERFIKTQLTEGTLFEPTEMTILPNKDVLIAQRRGEIMLYDESAGSIKQVGALNVYHSSGVEGVNAEEGVLGIAADPNFAKNNYVYIFYSPADTSVNRLSRFVYRNNKLQQDTEKVILQFYSQRQICCHTGGSIAFGPDNLLYVSTGDNSTPFDEPDQAYVNNGFAPLDDRPGHEQYDARRSAGNTNDLRGKILRIRLKEDGSYEIPEGNLFPKNQAKTRPEIYVMGDRNPYRISVDQKTGFLYWGEIGPDSGVDSLGTRGPRGYDEVNQAREAGFFGWPLFIGNNYPYRHYDYDAGRSGPVFNPKNPINNSRNNTGLQELPPAKPAFIWYPYAESKEFPQVGAGGRSAMAGPVYYNDLYENGGAYPAYYNGKLFIYDWIRNWIKAVSMEPNGDYRSMEPFMEGAEFNAPVDMEVGPDGKLYVLEYGSGWFSKNADAGLARLDYVSGNLPPKINRLYVDKTSGALPLTVKARVDATDPEGDRLRYVWKVGDYYQETKVPYIEHTIKGVGDHNVSVEVIDTKQASSKSSDVLVYAGNEQPEVDIAIKGNRTFYFPGEPVQYQVKVTDKDGAYSANNLHVSSDYVQGTDLAGASMGHQVLSEAMIGKNLMEASDCKSCHQVSEKSIGPSFTQVALRYQKDPEAPAFLTQKIIKGGSGVWGEAAMPAHPTMEPGEARRIVQWVLSLADTESMFESLPASGTIAPAPTTAQNTVLKLMATYTDQGSARVRPLAGAEAVYLRSNQMDAADFKETRWFAAREIDGSKFLVLPGGDGWLKADQVDLTGVRAIELTGLGSGQAGRYAVEVRVGNPNGKKIGEGQLNFGADKGKASGTIPLQQTSTNELQDVYLVFRPLTEVGKQKPMLKTVTFLPGTRA
ncbi:glucose/arabinose dehydrogenase [Pontibacter ummariensis]|uniref:Glucose/arabinose dehydrogenase, beta-propeller fold n=1 Tax=Pontibacter ummariensis TaxID=1610492 RepID=A0A239IQX4_9BACT|nr:ThuA domain-containing protein [Pontibacter ummariensis]PRY09708.1 glucose/arabinose dehydrogenase [Pontibacter ummariensis]SNS95473.1 Glucose/arabinose dehydrogenase, beta-propeller fold [Pontibacter ummariensis]